MQKKKVVKKKWGREGNRKGRRGRERGLAEKRGQGHWRWGVEGGRPQAGRGRRRREGRGGGGVGRGEEG